VDTDILFRGRLEAAWTSIDSDTLRRVVTAHGDLLLYVKGEFKLLLVYGDSFRLSAVPDHEDTTLSDWWDSPETQADDMLRYSEAVDFRKVLRVALDCSQEVVGSLTEEQRPYAEAVHAAMAREICAPARDKQTRRLLAECIDGLERGAVSHETNLAGSVFKELAWGGLMHLDGKTAGLVYPCANSVFNAARAVACARGFFVEDDSFGPDELPEFVDDEAAFKISCEFATKVRHHIPLSVIACAVVGERDPFPVLDLSTYWKM